MKDTRLIVLRGPSGAGKSSVAARLLAMATRPTALIAQDTFRFSFNVREGEAFSKAVRQMVRESILCALDKGFDVIAEGMLTSKGYRDVFAAVFQAHPRDNHLFYFDVSLEETLRRHRTRATSGLFTDDDMRSWYRPKDVLGHAFEVVIGEESTLEQTVARIQRATGLASTEAR